MISINGKLKRLADELYISYGSQERNKIDTSVVEIQRRLNFEFGDKITHTEVFGSYTRGTILPRKYDSNSDVDILVVFDTSNIQYHPITYRNQLRSFANSRYGSSYSFKDNPAVVIDLQNIRFDLVPAIINKGWFSDSLYIPQNDNNWQECIFRCV